MMNHKFLKTKCFTLYMCRAIGYLWFRIFDFNFTIKKINKNKPDVKKINVFRFGKWEIKKIKN